MSSVMEHIMVHPPNNNSMAGNSYGEYGSHDSEVKVHGSNAVYLNRI
jgi:hypothetical protein